MELVSDCGLFYYIRTTRNNYHTIDTNMSRDQREFKIGGEK